MVTQLAYPISCLRFYKTSAELTRLEAASIIEEAERGPTLTALGRTQKVFSDLKKQPNTTDL